MDFDAYVYLCALSKLFAYRCSVGRQLMDMFEDLSGLFEMRLSDLEELFRGDTELPRKIADRSVLEWARREVEWAGAYGIRLLGLNDKDYPSRLRECDDAPLMLYCKGPLDLNAKRVLAVVGTRKATYSGRTICTRIVEHLSTLSEKPLIISGLALGIDGTAHVAALQNSIGTVAVLPTGLDEIYPSQHRELAVRIAEKGALVTDFCRATSPVRHTFLRRNRIIAGMADATLLAESYASGGGLITVSLAESYGREIFAVPGRVTDPSFEGCNNLIGKSIASIVTDVDTVPRSMGWESEGVHRKKEDPLLFKPEDNTIKREVMKLLGDRSGLTLDEIALHTGLEAKDISVNMLELELDGRVISGEGGKFLLSL